MKKINFLFGIHCHQPVGNFESIFEEAYEMAYLPFIELINVHPKIKMVVHYSGVLYEWFEEKHPEFIEYLKKLVRRGQLEILTGGFYEPILPIIPEADKLGQIKMENEFIKKNFGVLPRGLWLTERIWEPHLPKSLSSLGIEYVIVDDYHFISAGVSQDELFGYYVTEEEGATLKIFPISKTLRYLIPFRLPEETINYLKSIATEDGGAAAIITDDGEKFGIWPGTHKWVYEEGYLEKLFKLLEENSSWINIMTPAEYIDSYQPLGKIYLPTASYFEMMEWSLPTKGGLHLEEIIKELKEKGKFEDYVQFFKGGFFRNFFVKYPEANNMHKKMLYVSNKIQMVQKEKVIQVDKDREEAIQSAQRELWRGQCNCAYWHGVFGGLYLNYLRHAIYEHLIAAEKTIDKVIHGKAPFIELAVTDFDKDGLDEILLSNDLINLYLSPSYGGSIFELDYKPKNYNLIDTLVRREEVYHKKLREAKGEEGEVIKEAGTPSIHELAKGKEPSLEKDLYYDWYRRVSLLDHFLSNSTDIEKFMRCTYEEAGDFIGKPFSHKGMKSGKEVIITLLRNGHVKVLQELLPVSVCKTISIFASQSIINMTYEITNLSNKELNLWFGVEFNFSMLSPNSPDRYYVFPGEKLDNKSLGSIGKIEGSAVKIVDEWQGFSVSLNLSQKGDIWRFPIETVSQSEAGYEKTYQSSTVFPNWKFDLESGSKWKLVITLRIES